MYLDIIQGMIKSHWRSLSKWDGKCRTANFFKHILVAMLRNSGKATNDKAVMIILVNIVVALAREVTGYLKRNGKVIYIFDVESVRLVNGFGGGSK